jgi:hypothetical protein
MKLLEKEAIIEIRERAVQVKVHNNREQPEEASEKLGRILTLCNALLDES